MSRSLELIVELVMDLQPTAIMSGFSIQNCSTQTLAPRKATLAALMTQLHTNLTARNKALNHSIGWLKCRVPPNSVGDNAASSLSIKASKTAQMTTICSCPPPAKWILHRLVQTNGSSTRTRSPTRKASKVEARNRCRSSEKSSMKRVKEVVSTRKQGKSPSTQPSRSG